MISTLSKLTNLPLEFRDCLTKLFERLLEKHKLHKCSQNEQSLKLSKYILLLLIAKLLQPCPALCDPMDCSPPGSSVHGFSRQECWRGLPWSPPGIFPSQGSNPCLFLMSPYWQAGCLPLVPPRKFKNTVYKIDN